MLYEITFPDQEVVYGDLATDDLADMLDLIEEHNKPFKITPSNSAYLIEYCFPVNDTDWIGMYFTDYYISDYCVPSFFWVKADTPRNPRENKNLLKLFQSYFGDLPENLYPYYVI